MTKTILNSYKNGNTEVTIYSDGSKERLYDSEVVLEHPESLDIKITNFCDANCSFCHEQSVRTGVHADIYELIKTLSLIPAGVEFCYGGGNSLSHPDLLFLLQTSKDQGCISNITVNQKHLERYRELLFKLIDEKLIHGLGISYSSKNYFEHIKPLLEKTDNIVFHLIAGVNKVSDIDDLNELCKSMNKKCKVLILGYKHFGFGINYYIKNKSVEDIKYSWYIKIGSYFKKDNLVISFDNLGIDQLNVKRFFPEKEWDKFYMGADFTHTMYVDAVNKQYAPTSTSTNRVNFSEINIIDYFCLNRNKG